MKLVQIIYTVILYLMLDGASAQVHYFDNSEVKLLQSPFLVAQNLNKKYILDMDPDRLLSPFLKEAGLETKKEQYTNWENTGLDGHIGGHYLSALSLLYATDKDVLVKERLDYMLRVLETVQKKNGNGYLGGVPQGMKMWDEIKRGEIKAGNFDLNGKWVPLYNIHKTYAGLRDAYLYTGSELAKEMLVNFADWMIGEVSALSDQQIQDILVSEHGGLNEVFADVYDFTKNVKYLKLSKQFSHQSILKPLLESVDKLTGLHANTQIPKVIGYKRIADLDQNDSWDRASEFFWDKVTTERSVVIGGNSAGEHFHPTTDFSKMIESVEGPETCNTYNMMRLSKMLFQTHPQSKYLEFYERAVYNHILSTQNPTTGGLVYFTQMRPGHYRVYSQPHTSMWCCVGSGIENHSKYGEMIYAYDKHSFYVNLFIPSQVSWKEKDLVVKQTNKFPYQNFSELTLNLTKSQKIALKVRKPTWSNANKFYLNGKQIKGVKILNGYYELNRKWRDGDKIRVEFDMKITVEQLPDKSDYYAFLYGPVVLSARIDGPPLSGLYADDSRGGHVARGEKMDLSEIPFLYGGRANIKNLVTRKNGDDIHFSLNVKDKGGQIAEYTLEPFYQLHNSRYILYWPYENANERFSQNEELDNKSIDRVICGQQQPESDHFVKMSQSTAGYDDDRHWRNTTDFFEYTFPYYQNARILRIELDNSVAAQQVEININDKPVMVFKSSGRSAVELVEIPLSDRLNESKPFTVRFKAVDKQATAKIFELRLLK
ncbi:glycosyl hydrolase [Sphingobacterium alkalisoli]|uniref:Glycosyl hydrolase n=1 Tax=Sphingobacterium alkalisoli TaxID=1874115 RepID=A0A4U0GU88_9SPHI|nr:glycoside hydrolase family 127 protein [Sphingobacterium alkalisoli]TJY62446.1 glycosyl hydrolase [Sphingobacterium alkalisoli]GGH29455.1 glycosyl hydrolase [Sphingobacterium alkalisoli]